MGNMQSKASWIAFSRERSRPKESTVMLDRRLGLLLAGIALASTVIACGGGGGGSAPPTTVVPATATPFVATATPVATTPPATGGTFVASSGPVTVIGQGATIGSTILPSSSNAYLVAQIGTAPVQTSSAGVTTLATYTATVTQTAGLATSAIARRTDDAATRAHLSAVRQNHEDPEARVWEVPQTAFAPTLRATAANLRAPGAESRTERGLRAPKAAATVGAQQSFVILGGTITGAAGSGNKTIVATLEAQSAHGNVWVDNAIVNNPTTFAAEFPSGISDFQATASYFESVYTTETAAYGPAFTTANLATTAFQQCDANKSALATSAYQPSADTAGTDPHIALVITDALAGTGEGGYYYGLNSFNQQVANCVGSVSNGVPMFVMGSNNYTPISDPNPANTFGQYNEYFWLNADMKRTVSHEFQHLLHFTNKYLQRVVNGQTGVLDDSWIDEGSSMLAEDLAGNGLVTDTPSFVYTYLLEPSDYSLTSFTGYNPNPLSSASPAPYVFNHNLAGDYGMSYLFLRYVYDRFGANALKALYASNGGGVAPITDAAGGETFPQLYSEWALATGIHAGGNGAALTSDPRYKYSSAEVLRGNITVISRRICCQTRTLVMPGPLAPEIFTNALPTGFITASTGASQSFQILDGGTAWLPGAISASGTTIRATSTSPTMQGGLLQGPIPAPSPTRF